MELILIATSLFLIPVVVGTAAILLYMFIITTFDVIQKGEWFNLGILIWMTTVVLLLFAGLISEFFL